MVVWWCAVFLWSWWCSRGDFCVVLLVVVLVAAVVVLSGRTVFSVSGCGAFVVAFLILFGRCGTLSTCSRGSRSFPQECHPKCILQGILKTVSCKECLTRVPLQCVLKSVPTTVFPQECHTKSVLPEPQVPYKSHTLPLLFVCYEERHNKSSQQQSFSSSTGCHECQECHTKTVSRYKECPSTVNHSLARASTQVSNKSVVPGTSYQEYLTKAVSQECHTIISRVSYQEYLANLTRVSHQSVSPRLSRQQGHTDRATQRASYQECPYQSVLQGCHYKCVLQAYCTLQD